MAEKWIEPEAYRISREEYEKDKVVKDIIDNEFRMMSLSECVMALQRMATREREKEESIQVASLIRKHRATAELYESIIFYLRAKNEVIKHMRN
jgi:hypothetical protein